MFATPVRPSITTIALVAALVAGCSSNGSGANSDETAPASLEDTTTTDATTTTVATTTTAPEFDHLSALPVSDGLVVGLFADSEVVTEGGVVTEWPDVTGNLTLTPIEDGPRLIEAARAGRDVVRFEDSARGMSASGFDDLPSGNTDRTVIVAGAWEPSGEGNASWIRGIGWGDPLTSGTNFFTGSINYNCFSQALPGIQTGLGDFGSVCGGQTTNEFSLADSEIVGVGYITVASRVEDGTLDLFYRDRLDESSDQVFETASNLVWIGTWPDIENIREFDFVTALIYDRALSDSEISDVVSHLASEYGVDA